MKWTGRKREKEHANEEEIKETPSKCIKFKGRKRAHKSGFFNWAQHQFYKRIFYLWLKARGLLTLRIED